MPQLVRLYIRQCLAGFGLATGFVAMLLWFDVGNLGHLVTQSDAGGLALFLLWFFNGLVFAGVQFAITVMRMAEDDDTPSGGPRLRAEPLRIRADAPARDRLAPRRRP
ncbi:hypothetical protein [Salipiger sp.]|uniref:hypothetical protein n=1 Tax=Salipiger sp. TaxID=2078585 RepID=UPI003A983603